MMFDDDLHGIVSLIRIAHLRRRFIPTACFFVRVEGLPCGEMTEGYSEPSPTLGNRPILRRRSNRQKTSWRLRSVTSKSSDSTSRLKASVYGRLSSARPTCVYASINRES